ncbi:MAG: NADH-quinone oxidoreductase subunit C [Deltaproteobacteria bacterium]|nr:NADH-quinone oxidoreductase subunit C [Deltaproteobacteria bacterium]
MSAELLKVRNGRAFARADVPAIPVDEWRRAILARVAEGDRLVALFGTDGGEQGVQLWAVLAADRAGVLRLGTTTIGTTEGGGYLSLTPECPQAHLFERELFELWGVRPNGHPWLKPVRFVAPRRGEGVAGKVGVMDFYRVEGEEIHEVAVGPVHAGVIEPGHFRFQCHGEVVFHLEISLGYQHRGVERAIVEDAGKRRIHYVETLAGDTTIGHASAYCHLVEALSGDRVPPRALVLRAIALELERLANHTGDLGALANDVAFLPTASYCGRLRGDFLNLTAAVCGNRFGRGLVRAGGVGFDVDDALAADMVQRLDAAMSDVESAVRLLWSSASVLARFENTGRVTTETAAALGLVGVAARASGLDRDVRLDHPWGFYRLHKIPVSTLPSGDVFARAYVRWAEIRRSAQFARELLRSLPRGASRVAHGPLAKERVCVSLVEGWRGEICHVGATDEQGRLAVYKVIDPSFHNWSGLAMALRDQQISDFPLCNKSFDLSYCGFDL